MSKVAILGAGVYGTALGGILAENGYDVDYYDPLKEKERLKDVVSNSFAVVLSLPSSSALHLLPHLQKGIYLIVASKGFLSEKPFNEFPSWGIISGAGFAKDFKSNHSIQLTVTDHKISDMFYAPNLSFDYTSDKKGVLLCGALKNVYALIAGKSNLKPDSKSLQNFIWSASNEMGMILKSNGAKLKTIRLSCGIKDLILTCSPDSRNYSYGLSSQKGFKNAPSETVESMSTIRRILRHEILIPDSAKILLNFLEEIKNEIEF